MATRAERAEAAIEAAGETTDLLWALALNRGAVRRRYLESVTGMAARPLVKALARLANDGVVAPTEGLVFQLDRKAYGKEIDARIPREDALRIHEASLEWLAAIEGDEPEFRLEHLVGAERWPEASDALVDRIAARESEDGSLTPVEVARAKSVLLGMMNDASANRGRIFELGVTLVERGRFGLKPTEIKNLITSLRELEPGTELDARLELAESSAKNEAKARRKKKKEDREASAAPVAPEGEDVALKT